MILFESCGLREGHPAYANLAAANYLRQIDLLDSLIDAALATNQLCLSQTVIKALNYHAIACLHPYAGEYRPCEVDVGSFRPPAHYRVTSLMDDMVNRVNSSWGTVEPLSLAAYVLWKINWIHPFINGNGRTSRAACYYVLSLGIGGRMGGRVILPELIRQNRPQYVAALQAIDQSTEPEFFKRVQPLRILLGQLLMKQVAST